MASSAGQRPATPPEDKGVLKPVPTSTTSAEATTVAAPQKRGKRRRTRSHNSSPSPGRGFFVPGFENGGGFKMMSLSELMDAAKGVTNMYLAHEIAVDRNFTLDKLKQEEQQGDDGEDGGRQRVSSPTSVEAQIRKVVHQAFWDALEAELQEEPVPCYNQALSLLTEVRDSLCRLLMPSQHRIRQDIVERLDVDLIRQQAENGVLNFNDYADYVLDLMGKLCAPVRDEEVQALKDMDKRQVVKVFQGIMKTLDHMRLDMANFMIQQARPLIVSHSVEYEKAKFKEFLRAQTDGLELTRAWLKRHRPEQEALDRADADPRFKKMLINRILTDAYVELLEWDEYHPLPETLAMDHKRVVALRDQTERVAVSTAVILVTFSNASGFVVPADAQKLKETMKGHVDVLLQDFFDDTDLLRILPGVGLQAVKDLNDYLAKAGKAPMPDSAARNVRDQIDEMEDPNHRVRDLVQRRILDFNKQAITAARTAPLQIPPGLTLCQRQLASIADAFVRLVSYNRAVFGEFYDDIIENHVLFTLPGELRSTMIKED